MGLLDNIGNSPEKKLSHAELAISISDIIFGKADKDNLPNITLHTGFGGMIEFSWRMMGIEGTIPCRFWVSREKGHQVSLGTKHGMLKFIIKRSKLDNYCISIRYGTKEIGRTNNFDDLKKYIFNY